MPALASSETNITRIVASINELWQGRSNAIGKVTLAVSPATQTIVPAINCGARSVPLLTPLTAHAAAELGAGTMYVSAVTQGQFTVVHSASSQTDRTFGYAIQG